MQTAIDLTHLPIRTALADKAAEETSKAKDIIQFYLDNYAEVYQLICDKCKEVLALEVLDLSNLNQFHHDGRTVIPLSNGFKSHRARLDGAMGYQCGTIVETKFKKEWDKFNKAIEKRAKKQAALDKKYQSALKKWEKLPIKEQVKTPQPQGEILPYPKEPEGPAYAPCGNDTRWSKVEYEAVKHGGAELPPHDIAKIKKHLETISYTPDVHTNGKDTITETFRVRRLK